MTTTIISYDHVKVLVGEINKLLLKSECGFVLQVTVDKKNNLTAADVVPLEIAFGRGFDAVRLMKGNNVLPPQLPPAT